MYWRFEYPLYKHSIKTIYKRVRATAGVFLIIVAQSMDSGRVYLTTKNRPTLRQWGKEGVVR